MINETDVSRSATSFKIGLKNEHPKMKNSSLSLYFLKKYMRVYLNEEQKFT